MDWLPRCCDRDLTDTGHLLGWTYDHACAGQSVALDLGLLRRYLQCLITDEQLRREMGQRSRMRAVQLFSYTAVTKQYRELFAELSMEAQSLSLPPGTCRFDQPRYYDCFQGYASVQLGDDTLLRLTPAGNATANQAASLLPPLSDHWQVRSAFTDSLLRDVLHALQGRGTAGPSSSGQAVVAVAGGAPTLGGLVGSLTSRENHHPDRVRRHVMWLIKYGLAEPVVT